MKILIIKFRNIGDVLLATPLIENLKYHYPDARIDFACNDGTQMVLKGNENIGKIHVYERERLRKKGILGRIWGELKFLLAIKKEKYDLVLQTTTGDRGVILAKYARAKKIIGFKSKNASINAMMTHFIEPYSVPFEHTVEKNLRLLDALGLKIVSKKVRIFGSELSIDLPQKFVHFHITSRWMFKCASDELMAELIDFTQLELGIRVVLSGDGSDVESAKIASVLLLCKSNPINLNGALSLSQVATLSACSLAYVGVDTAVMHMAAANGVPVIAFFGPSSSFEWGPWDNDEPKSGYNARNGVQEMGHNIVFQKAWECVPCGKDGCDGSKKSRCLLEWSEDEKMAIKEAIKKRVL